MSRGRIFVILHISCLSIQLKASKMSLRLVKHQVHKKNVFNIKKHILEVGKCSVCWRIQNSIKMFVNIFSRKQ